MALAMGLTSKKLLAIDWDSRDVRAVLFRARADGIDLLKAVSVPIPANVDSTDAESLGVFLREALRQARIGAKHALLMIPRDRVVLNTLNLPPTPEEDLASMIQFQIAKELPFSADQATIDFATVREFDPKSACDVMVAAVRNEELTFYRTMAHEAGLTIKSIGLRPHGNLVAVAANWPELSSGSTLIIEVGPTFTEIDIVRDGVLTFSRAASLSLTELFAPAPERVDDSRIMGAVVTDRTPDDASKRAVEAVLLEVSRSYEAFRATQADLSVDRVVVAGASGIESELARSLGARFAVKAELYAADRALNLSEKRSRELRGFSAAIGLAMNHGSKGLSHFDFLHPKRPVSKRSAQMRKAPIAAAAAMLFLAAAVVAHSAYVTPQTASATARQKKAAEMKKRAESVAGFKSKVDALVVWQRAEQCWPEVLAKITQAFPPSDEAYATRVVLDTRIARKRKKVSSSSSARVQMRTLTSPVVNGVSERMLKMGFQEVLPGTTNPMGRGQDYPFDTKVDAKIPKRPKPKKRPTEEASTDEAGDEADNGVEAGDVGGASTTQPADGAADEKAGGESAASDDKQGASTAADEDGPAAEPTGAGPAKTTTVDKDESPPATSRDGDTKKAGGA